jgi:hypothetical protein
MLRGSDSSCRGNANTRKHTRHFRVAWATFGALPVAVFFFAFQGSPNGHDHSAEYRRFYKGLPI